jgi:hypothetical protein
VIRPIRSLTPAERAALSPGLLAALAAAGAFPRIRPMASWLARIAALWRGSVPVLTLGDVIHWPRAPADASVSPAAMALLQHELQHVLEYAEGRLTWWGYGLDPRNWTYALPPPERWDWRRLGAEQRATIAERLWRAQRAGDQETARCCAAVLPWAAHSAAAADP